MKRLAPRGRVRKRLLGWLIFLVALAGLGGASYLDRLLNMGVAWGAGMTPIPHSGASLMGINTFLDREPERAKVEQSLRMSAEAGFKYVRQAFPWYDIEIAAKGDFTDRRDPANVKSAWDKYDYIVETANSLGLELLVRLDGTPLWARPAGAAETGIGYHKGPPADNQDFADFVSTLVERYKGKVRYYQIWNEPNLAVEWAGPADAHAYSDLLRVTYAAVKQADPAAVVVMAGLAPTVDRVEIGGNQDELIFLRQMYEAGAKDYFDVASAMIYGLGYSPDTRFTDHRLPGDNRRVNFSRVWLARAVMLEHGDAAKPLWASEYGWLSMEPGWEGKPSTWGDSVDEETQARYLVQGYERAEAEWPWMGVMFVWHLRDPNPPAGEPQRFFSILNQDFSPRPGYGALAEYSRRYPVADTGAYPLDSPAASFSPSGGTIKFKGTRLDLVYARGEDVIVLRGTLDGQAPPGWQDGTTRLSEGTILPAGWPGAAGASNIYQAPLLSGLAEQEHLLELSYEGGEPQVLGFVVGREQALPWLFPAAYALLSLLAIWGAVRFALSFARG